MPTATSQASSSTPSPPLPFPQAVTEPEWKKNLYKTIEGTFRSLVDDAKREYDERIAAAGTEEGRGLAEEEYHKTMDNIRNLAKESFQAQLDRERQGPTLALMRIKQADQEESTSPVEKTSEDTTADTTTGHSSTSEYTSALDRIGGLPADPSASFHDAPTTILAASPRNNVESLDGQLSQGPEIWNFGPLHPQPVPSPLARHAASMLGAAPINVVVEDLPPEHAVRRVEYSPQSQPGSKDDSLRSPIPSFPSSEAGQSRYQLTSANDQVRVGPGGDVQGLQEGKLPSAAPLPPSPSHHERWLPAEKIVPYTPGALLRPSLPRHEKWLPSTEEAVAPSPRAASQPLPSPHERWLPSTKRETVSPAPILPSPERHERWLRSARAILPSNSRTSPPQGPRPISDMPLTNVATTDFPAELTARGRQYNSLYWEGYPKHPSSSLSSPKNEGSPQNSQASADDRVPTESQDSGSFGGDVNGWNQMLRRVEDISRQWEVVRLHEASGQEAPGIKGEARKSEDLKPRHQEQEARNKEEELAKREQELKKREEDASQKELEFVRKDQEAKKKEEELRRREEELCEEKRRFEGQREEVRRKEEELRRQLETEASGREEVQRRKTLINNGLIPQGADSREHEEQIRHLRRTDEEATKGEKWLGREQEEPNCQLSAENDKGSKQAGVRDAERRLIDEIWRQKQTGEREREQGEERQEIHQQAEEGKHQRTYADAYYPASSSFPSWVNAWGSSRSSWSARTSIASYSTIFEQTDDGMIDWQRRQEEMYHEQQEQFRKEQERLESPNQAHGVSRGPTKKAA